MKNDKEKNMLTKKIAFTIAEVLIVLGIIGIIAEMTIPTLMRNTQDAEFKAGFKKAFSEIAQALTMYNHEMGNSFVTDPMAGSIDPAFWNYFKTTKICEDSVAEGCWHSTFYALNGGTAQVKLGKNAIPVKQGAILNSGMLVGMRVLIPGPTTIGLTSSIPISDCANNAMTLSDYGYTNGNRIVYLIDVNGFKGPNRVGKDIYIVYSMDTYFLKPPVTNDSEGNAYSSCDCYGNTCSYATLIGSN